MRIGTGIDGLDALMKGGFPERTINLLGGPAGSGKSLMAMQFVYNGAMKFEEPGIFVALEESRENILRAAGQYGMDLERMEEKGLLSVIDFGELRKDYTSEDEREIGIVSFSTLQEFLENLLKRTEAKRLVIDSIGAASLYYASIDSLRRELFKFCRFLKEQGITSVLVTESSAKNLTRFDVEQFVADSLIILGYENVNGEYRRTVTIYKMRFTKHDPYKHPFLILGDGIEVSEEEIIL